MITKTNFFAEKFGFFVDNDPTKDLNEKNYDEFMNHLYGKDFAEFLKEWVGLTKDNATNFFIDGLTYIRENEDQFDT